jgi:hypothetical protein
MALIELCDADELGCSELVICVDRELKLGDLEAWMKNLRWIGFDTFTLADWTDYGEITSKKWLFFSMDV